MLSTIFIHCIRLALVATLLCSISVQVANSTTLTIPDYPLFLTSTGVPPNLTLTLDDSGSMAWAYTPDLVPSNYYAEYNSALDGRYVKSAAYNPIYYNPKITYTAPVVVTGVDASGNAILTTLSTTFNAAYLNGFNTSSAKLDLSQQYQPTAGMYPYTTTDTSTTHWHMRHYSNDVACNRVSKKYRCQYNKAAGLSSTPTWVDMPSTPSCSSSGDCQPSSTGTTQFMPAYYYVYNTSKSECDKSPATLTDNNCYNIVIVSATSGINRGDGSGNDERQNFANWFSFYRTRNLMTVSAASLAMSTLLNTVRVAWQAINSCYTSGRYPSLVTNYCQGWDSSAKTVNNKIYPFSGQHEMDFYSWLTRLPASGGTPLLTAVQRAGDYYKTTGSSSPYDDDLTSSSTDTMATCRKNYQLIMTDGMWNSDSVNSSDSYKNYDSTSHTLPDSTAYSSQTPYKDSNSSSLADVAFYYWANDLVPELLANDVSASIVDPSGTASKQYFNAKNDPATWQHMVNYTVGLGMTPYLISTSGGELSWGGDTYSGSYTDIVNGNKSWPTTSNSGVNGNAADLWHAAIDSRGKFYNVDDPQDMNAAFQDIINTISSAADSGGGSAVSYNVGRTTDTGATTFVAGFNADWSGTLEAVAMDANGSLASTTGTHGETILVDTWEAGSLIPPGNQQSPDLSRHIYTLNDGVAQEFVLSICNSSSSLTTALNQDPLNPDSSGNPTVDSLCSQRLAWLRGYIAITGVSAWDSTNKKITFTAPQHGLKAGDEVTVSGVTLTGTTPTALNTNKYTISSVTNDTFTVPIPTDPGGTYVTDTDRNDRVRYTNFRNRTTSVLGDIIDSTPVFVYKDDFGYGGASIKVTGQDSYANYVAAKASKVPVVYVGANDGMLHAFNAAISGSGMGMELFAYIPAGVYDNLSVLTNPNYTASHKFFVDGTPTVHDAYIGSRWGTYLVGSLRKGSRSIYALDVSSPDSFSATNVKWEFTDTKDLGLTFGQPQIAAVSAIQWAAIFGNGYNSTNQDAVLYIVDLGTGSQIAKISTGSSPSNGLFTPYPFDQDGDGIVDVIYAGDLQGHLWKFEKNALGVWILGNGGKALFTALNNSNKVQPITSQPKAVVLSSDTTLVPSPFNGQLMVYFGTGRYLTSDPTKPTDTSVNDLLNSNMQTFYGIMDTSSGATVSRTKLLQQTIKSTTTTAGETYRVISDNAIVDTSIRGCYLDFDTTTPPAPSERILASPLIKVFKTLQTRVIFTTSVPTADACAKGGISWLMELSASCGRLAESPFDVNNNGTFDEVGDLVNDGAGGTAAVGGMSLSLLVPSSDAPPWIEGTAPATSGKSIAYKLLTDTKGNVIRVPQLSEYIITGSGSPTPISWEQIQ